MLYWAALTWSSCSLSPNFSPSPSHKHLYCQGCSKSDKPAIKSVYGIFLSSKLQEAQMYSANIAKLHKTIKCNAPPFLL